MLRELQIKNIAVIDEVSIEFGRGFNVLTGETGAGKSILIDSINMALGSRVSRDLIRSGCDSAMVSVCFEVESKGTSEKLAELDVETEDGMVLISRRMDSEGKSTCRINGVITPASVVREVASILIDIHGQNDNMSLLSSKNHLGILDEYGRLGDKVEKYRLEYRKMSEILKEKEKLSADEAEKKRRQELLEFQIGEIAAARLVASEDEELEKKRDYLYNIESIISGAGAAYGALYGGEEYSAYDLLRRAARSLSEISCFEPKLETSFARLENVIAETEDIAAEVNSCLSGTDFSMAELDRVEERLDTIGNLKRKYGNSINEILEYCKKARTEADSIAKSDERLAELDSELKKLHTEVEMLAEELSTSRRATASELEGKIMAELSELDMPKVRFSIALEDRICGEDIEYTQNGKDLVEFMISTNPGESLKPMSKIASGGELSRIMLAMKSVIVDNGTADTMIFDEIDTGVSGRAAQKIAEKICHLSSQKQIFSITHLAQIAGMADNHYLIKKNLTEDRTSTSVTLLDNDARTEELARIIGGVSVTELTLQNAREMLDMAARKKQSK